MPSSISDGAAAVEFLDEKVIKSNGQPPEATNPTKHANVRWADSVKRACGKVGSGIASFLEKPVLGKIGFGKFDFDQSSILTYRQF